MKINTSFLFFLSLEKIGLNTKSSLSTSNLKLFLFFKLIFKKLTELFNVNLLNILLFNL